MSPWPPTLDLLALEHARTARPGQARAAEEVQADVAQYRAKLEAYDQLCQKLGEQQANVALAWLLHRKGVTAPIIGPRTVLQLEASLRALDISLTAESLAELDKIFPGPAGPAPEAYAW